MKNKIIVKIMTVLFVGAVVFTGCSGLSSGSKDNTQTSAQATNQTKDSQVAMTEQAKDTSSEQAQSTENISKADNADKASSEDIFSTIKTKAAQGMVINSDYQANESVTLSDIETAFGAPDSPAAWVPSAAGYYEEFSAKKLAFGANKGEAVFEIRSFDDSLKSITMQQLETQYGKPDYSTTANKEKIVGYVVNDDYKLLFVFPQTTGEEATWTLDHYSVFYPAGTANSMADYAGREW